MVGIVGRFLSFFGGSISVSAAQGSNKAALALLREAERLYPKELYPSGESFDYALDVAVSIVEKIELPLTTALLLPLAEAIEQFAISNAIVPIDTDVHASIHDGSENFEDREYLKAHIAFHKASVSNKQMFELAILRFMQALMAELPSASYGSNETSTGFGVKLGDLLANPHAAIDQLFDYAFAGELKKAGLFADLKYQIDVNICNASGIDPDNPTTNLSKYIKPCDYQGSREELIDGYLAFTPFQKLLETRLSFTIPTTARFEHTHVVGGTGHGKTQLLSHLVLQDMGEIL